MYNAKMVAKTMAALFFAASLFYGCSKKDDPVAPPPTVTVSKTALCHIGDYDGWVVLVSDPTADTSQSNATLSWGGNKTSRVFQDKFVWTGYIGFEWDADLGYSHRFMDTVLTLTVTSNVGNCQGSIQLPEGAYINTPSYNDTLPIDSVICTWAVAARAEWYQVYYYAYAYDASGYYLGWMGSKETFTTDTSMIIPASYFNYPGAQYYQVYLSVYPYRGPKPQAGSTGNMTGTIKGFLVGEGERDHTSFYVGTPSKNIKTPKMEHKEPNRQERMDSYLQKISGQ